MFSFWRKAKPERAGSVCRVPGCLPGPWPPAGPAMAARGAPSLWGPSWHQPGGQSPGNLRPALERRWRAGRRGAFPSSGETCALPQRRLPSNPSGRGCFGGSETGIGMHDVTLAQVALFLAAAVVAAPLAKLLRVGNVLGYLLVGVLIGPATLGLVSDVGSVLHLAEFGVIMLLFVIGLELRPRRLWAMRSTIFGLGSAQVAITGVVLAAAAMAFGMKWQAALFAGL